MKWHTAAVGTVLGSAVIGIGLLGWSAGASFAQITIPGARPPMMGGMSGVVTHQQMHAMMDAMHGAGTSERMHQAMGPEAEQMMEQCSSMMQMMQHMSGMMGMHGGQSGQNSMMGR